MKRILCCVSLISALGATSSPSIAAADSAKFCTVSAKGTVIVAGSKPDYPQTTCTYAKATLRKINVKADREENLGNPFHVVVNGQRLSCLTLPAKKRKLYVMVCSNPRRYVGFVFRA